jgi:hypothetical protein
VSIAVRTRIANALVGFLLLAATENAAFARKLINGADVPDRYIIDNHPAIGAGRRVSRTLLSRYGFETNFSHCFFMRPNGSLGNVSLFSIMAIGLNEWGPDALANKLSAQQLAINHQSDEQVARVLVQYALKQSGNDPYRAAQFVKEAERHDSRCLQADLKFSKAEIDLHYKRQVPFLDANGKWIVVDMSDSDISPGSLPLKIGHMKRNSFWVDVAARGYGIAYSLLSSDLTEKGKPSSGWNTQVKQGAQQKDQRENLPGYSEQSAANLPPTSAASDRAKFRPTEIVEAQSAIKSALAKVREHCLIRARTDCG